MHSGCKPWRPGFKIPIETKNSLNQILLLLMMMYRKKKAKKKKIETKKH